MKYVNNKKILPEDLKKIRDLTFLFSQAKDVDKLLGLKTYLSDIKFKINFNEFVDSIKEYPDKTFMVDVANLNKHFMAYGIVITSDITKDAIFIGTVHNFDKSKDLIIDLTESTLPKFLKANDTTYSIGIMKKDEINIADKEEFMEVLKAFIKSYTPEFNDFQREELSFALE